MDNEELKKCIESIKIDLPVPDPLPSLAKYDLIFNKSRDFEDKFEIEQKIVTPRYLYQEPNLLELLHNSLQSKPVKKPNKPKKQEIEFVYEDLPEISYLDIVKESFDQIKEEIDLEDVDCVYDLFPDYNESEIATTNLENDGFDIEVLEKYNLKNMPKLVTISNKEYNCMPVDMSEYVFVRFENDKAYYKEIAANLNLKPKK